jgi:hypothetical protein
MTFTSPHNQVSRKPGMPETQGPAPLEMEYRQDVAHYVSSMLTELRQIAGKAGFEKLVTAIDAAYYEAYGALDTQMRQAAAPQEGHHEDREKITSAMEPNGS